MLNKQRSRIFLYAPPVSSHKLQYSHVRIEIILTILKALFSVYLCLAGCVKQRNTVSVVWPVVPASLPPFFQIANQAEKRLTTCPTLTIQSLYTALVTVTKRGLKSHFILFMFQFPSKGQYLLWWGGEPRRSSQQCHHPGFLNFLFLA